MIVEDQMKRQVELENTPQRIVSLVPSQTQLLHFLGLEEEVVGITKFCISPDEWWRNKTRVGGTKAVKRDVVEALKPDLIIGNKEENAQSDIEELLDVAPIWMSDIYTLEDALEMIASVAEICEKKEQGIQLIQSIKKAFQQLEEAVKNRPNCSALYYIWQQPNMVSGKHTFVDDMLQRCGFINATQELRYPEIDTLENDPDVVLLSSEPFPFKEEHRLAFQERFPRSKVVLVDGEMFSWYGSKLKDAPSYFLNLWKQIDHS